MPQIPTYIAQGKAAEQEYSRDVPVENFSALSAAGQQIQQTGQQVGQIAGNFNYIEAVAKAEAAKNEFKIGKSDYDALVRNAKEEINTDSLILDKAQAEKAFIFREKEIRKKVSDNLLIPEAKTAFDTHARENYLSSVVDARAIGVKKAGEYAIGQLDKLKASTVNNASRAASFEEFEKELNNYENSLVSARGQGLIGPKEFENRKIDITKRAYDARADVLINQDPALFRLTVQRGDFNNMSREALAGKMEKADAESHQRQIRIDQETTKVKRQTEEYWGKLAMLRDKSLPGMIANARAGRDPFMTDPDTINKYEKLYFNPPTIELDNAVRLMKQNYRAEFVLNPSEAIIDKYAAQALALKTDNPNNELSILFNELSSDKGQLRGIDAAGFARVSRTLAGEIGDLKTPKFGMPRIDAMFEKFDQNDAQKLKAAAYDVWRRGGSPADMEAAILEKSKEIKSEKAKQGGRNKSQQELEDEAIYGRR